MSPVTVHNTGISEIVQLYLLIKKSSCTSGSDFSFGSSRVLSPIFQIDKETDRVNVYSNRRWWMSRHSVGWVGLSPEVTLGPWLQSGTGDQKGLASVVRCGQQAFLLLGERVETGGERWGVSTSPHHDRPRHSVVAFRCQEMC